ncbi:MAG: ATP-dependent dethiobiotin synthetase BioD [Marinilabiliaceae bacterium]|nr:ATP-dependent dethiobiotin synthetase BioD [Marinilabiliaceae bacterium]
MPTYFITAIDTDSGKTIATGLLAKSFAYAGYNTITMKIAQTGCKGISDDIIEHRKLMGIELTDDDKKGITCPYIFSLPASPHLSAKFENIKIDTQVILNNIKTLEQKYDVVLVEGVGGLMVPINNDEMVIDFIKKNHLPTILVTSAKLGSLNHTFLSLDVCYNKGIELAGIIYNNYPQNNAEITDDSREQIQKYSSSFFPKSKWAEIPVLAIENHLITDLSVFIER